jgi:hypothetical protein
MTDESAFEHVDWSYSAASLYESCPRRFFHRYSRSSEAGQTASTSGNHSASPPGAYLGSVVHAAIATQINRWRQNRHIHLQQAQNEAVEKVQDYVDNYFERLQAYPDTAQNIDREDLADSLIRTAKRHLKCFFQVIWPQLDSHTYILHEKTRSFTMDEHTVTVRPDLCTRTADGDFVITDWKTGEHEGFHEPTTQQRIYALWAHQEYEPDLDRILVQLVYTKNGEFDPTRVTQEEFQDLRRRIDTERSQWLAATSMAEFPPDPEVQKCGRCPYLSRCEAGQNTRSP